MTTNKPLYLATLLLTAAVLSGCGSSIDSGVRPANAGLEPDSADGVHQTLATYDVTVDPLTGSITYEPTALGINLSTVPEPLAQVLTSSMVTITNGNTTIFDSSNAELRLSGINNTGLCVTNNHPLNNHYNNLVMKMRAFTPSSAYASKGAVSDGQGGYTVAFGNVAYNSAACRPVSLVAPEMSSFRFQLTFEADLTASVPTRYITSINTTSWLVGNTITITGLDLTNTGSPTVCIGGSNSPSFCTGGYLISSFSSFGAAQITFATTLAMNGATGFISVNNGKAFIDGPYVTWTTALTVPLALPSGTNTAGVFFRTWDTAEGITANGCPAAGTFDDTEIVNSVALSTTPSTITMAYLNAGATNENIYIAYDANHSGTLNAGDYYAFIPHATFANYVSSTPVNLAAHGVQSAGFLGGQDHTCGLTTGGALYCWGFNDTGELGVNTIGGTYNTPTAVTGMSSGVTAVTLGAYSTCAIRNGAAYCWGYNGEFNSLLGIGVVDEGYYDTPQAVANFDDGVTALAMGESMACGIQYGALYCWGSGEIGDGNWGADKPAAVNSPLNSSVTAVSVSSMGHVCALKNGAAYCWGANNDGQLGDGTTTDRSTPVAVSGLSSGVTHISADGYTTCAVHNGAAKCWGYNTYHQLGDGTTTDRRVPTQVLGLTTGVTQIDTGFGHACAVRNGAAYCWGDLSYAAGGTPAAVSGMASGVTSVSAGPDYSCGLRNGSSYCWGTTGSGGFGAGAAVGDSSSAVLTSGSLSFPASTITFTNMISGTCP